MPARVCILSTSNTAIFSQKIHSVLPAQFYTTVARLADLPADSEAEVAFAGRSNAGKSSAINAIAQQRRLAFVSKTPGRTQQLNFFQVAPRRFLVDLPGYGYARAPFAQQRAWQALIGAYLAHRPALCGLVLIMDIRHPFTPLDRQLLAWFAPTGKPVHVLLSKADKLSRSQGIETQRAAVRTLAELGVEGGVQLFSGLRRQGLDEAEAVLRQWLGIACKKSPAEGDTAGPTVP